jgi:hypothetical protein
MGKTVKEMKIIWHSVEIVEFYVLYECKLAKNCVTKK